MILTLTLEIWCKKMVSEFALLFDTNVFNRMIAPAGDEYCLEVYKQIQGPIVPVNQTMWSFITPFLLLEILGVVFQEARHDDILAKLTSSTADETTKEVVNLVEQIYFQKSELSEVHFKQRFDRHNNSATALGKALLRDVIEPKINAKHIEILVKNLALDFHYGFPYSRKIKSKNEQLRIHINFMLDVCRVFLHQSHLSPARGMFEVTETLRKKNQNILATLKDLLKQKDGLKLYGDRGDLDIVHLAVMGSFLNGQHKKILAVTGDDPAQLRKRIAGYKNIIHHFLNHLKLSGLCRDNPEYGNIQLKQGLVLVLDQKSGQKRELIDVEQVEIHD